MNIINLKFPRPDEELINKFNNISTPVLSDVMGRNRCMDYRVRPVHKRSRVVGVAFTIRTYPADNLMIHAGVQMCQKGDILVVDAGGYPNAGLWGELLTLAAIKKGIKGLILDGGIRDINEIETLGFPAFSAGVNARGGFKNSPGAIGTTISCGGITVNPGDIIVADENGVVVVPQDYAEKVHDMAMEKLQQEEDKRKKIEAGLDLFDKTKLENELKNLGIDIIR